MKTALAQVSPQSTIEGSHPHPVTARSGRLGPLTW